MSAMRNGYENPVPELRWPQCHGDVLLRLHWEALDWCGRNLLSYQCRTCQHQVATEPVTAEVRWRASLGY